MNESLRPRIISSLRRFSLAIGTAALLLPAIGCVNGDSLRSAHVTDSDTEAMLAESRVMQSENGKADAVDVSPASMATSEKKTLSRTTSKTTLVSAKTNAMPIRQTIVNLPTNADLQQQLSAAQGPVLLDFYAEWCGPCHKQSAILHEVEEAAAKSQTTIIKINVDEHRELAQQLSVSSLPTLIMVHDGQVTQRQSGIATKQQLTNWMR